MKKYVVYSMVIMLAGVASPALAAGDAAAGKARAAACAGCHGMDGNSANPAWPKLAGQHPAYLVKQLQDFKEGRRRNAMMAPMAMGLDDKGMADVAAFYSSQEGSTGEADPGLVELGERIYRGGNRDSGVTACMGCHGPSGAGNPAAGFPALGGQHAAYTKAQLQAFKAGERDNDSGKMMRNIAAKMSEAEMEAVASYIQGLH